jgi:hypothetical protein
MTRLWRNKIRNTTEFWIVLRGAQSRVSAKGPGTVPFRIAYTENPFERGG